MSETSGGETFKKGEFNFVRAWEEWAKPAYDALPTSITATVRKVHDVARDLSQGEDLDMPWPEGLREVFEEFPSELLAEASRVVYWCGHWHPTKKGAPQPWLQEYGAYWKFSNYADQILSARLGVSRSRDYNRNGPAFWVAQGSLELLLTSPCASHRASLGFATSAVRVRFEEILRAVRVRFEEILRGAERGTDSRSGWEVLWTIGFKRRADWDKWLEDSLALAEFAKPSLLPTTGPMTGAFDFSRYLVKE